MYTATATTASAGCLLAAAVRAAAEEDETAATSPGEAYAYDAQQQVTLRGLTIVLVGSVAALLISCAYRYCQGAYAFYNLILADYLRFVLTSARGAFTRTAPQTHDATADDADAVAPAHVDLDEWLQAAKETAPSTKTADDDRDSDVFSEESEAPEPLIVPGDLELHQPHASDLSPAPADTPRGGGQERPFSLFADKLESPPKIDSPTDFTDAVEGPGDYDTVEAAVEAAVDGAILAASAQTSNAANLDGSEKSQQPALATSPKTLATVTEVADESEDTEAEQLLRMAAGCEPPPELISATPEGLRKRRKPTALGCGMLSRSRQQ